MTFLLCANQRSGTHALKDALRNAASYRDAGEVLNFQERARETNFFFWLQAKSSIQKYAVERSREVSRELARSYMDYLQRPRAPADPRREVQHLRGPGRAAFAPELSALLPRLLHGDGAADRTHQSGRICPGPYVSDIFMTDSQVDHAYVDHGEMVFSFSGKRRPAQEIALDRALQINPAAALNYMRLIATEQRLFTGFLAQYERACTLVYEEIFAQDKLTAGVRMELERVLGMPLPGEVATSARRLPVRYADLIQNLDELLSAFTGPSTRKASRHLRRS